MPEKPARQRVARSKSTPLTHLVNICLAAHSHTVGTPDQKVKDISAAGRVCESFLFYFSPPAPPPSPPPCLERLSRPPARRSVVNVYTVIDLALLGNAGATTSDQRLY